MLSAAPCGEVLRIRGHVNQKTRSAINAWLNTGALDDGGTP